MDPVDEYLRAVTDLLSRIRSTERENLEKAAQAVAEAVADGHLVHVYGTGGHSYIGAEEMFYRAGGLVPINPVLDPGVSLAFGAARSTAVERLPGYSQRVLQHYDLRPKDVLIVVNAYGINSATIDAANEGKRLGLTVIAVTSPEFSRAILIDHSARHPSKKNLFEVADITIDCHMPFGDAVLQLAGFQQKVAPVSTIVNSFVLNCMIARAIQILLGKGVTPPVWISSNIPGGDEFNKKWIEKYRGKIKHL